MQAGPSSRAAHLLRPVCQHQRHGPAQQPGGEAAGGGQQDHARAGAQAGIQRAPQRPNQGLHLGAGPTGVGEAAEGWAGHAEAAMGRGGGACQLQDRGSLQRGHKAAASWGRQMQGGREGGNQAPASAVWEALSQAASPLLR